MKVTKFVAFLMFAGMGMMMTSCEDEEEEEIIVNFEGKSWSQYIDNPQYNGELLYGKNAASYSWTDAKTTLSGGMTNSWGGYYGFAEGGSAISNYIDSDIENHNTWDYQLSVPVSNGSNNFVVVYCSSSATISFQKGTNFQLNSMDICPTTYTLGVEKYGNSYASALTGEGSYLTLIITADNGQSMNVDLARNGEILSTWKTISLSELGVVNSLTFTMTGSDQGSYGLNTPAYFAFDNVKIAQ